MAATGLKRSQLETLRAVADHPGGYIRVIELAELQGIKKPAAERKLRALASSHHLRRTSRRPFGPCFVITELGKEALGEGE